MHIFKHELSLVFVEEEEEIKSNFNESDDLGNKTKKNVTKVGQAQIEDLLFGEQLSWQTIIYDLINTEQLDPWDLDLVVLANSFLEKVKTMEETNFFVSSKVLLATSLLLRLKSEVLLNEYLPSLDAIFFGKKEDKRYIQERIELDEDIPGLIPRTPLPRYRRISLQELMSALGKAINTENRRIRRVVISRQQEFETALSLPRTHINLKDRIHTIFSLLRVHFASGKEKVAFSDISGKTNFEKISNFVPLLHLDNQKRVWLDQEEHFNEIWVWLHSHYFEHYGNTLYAKLEEQLEREQYGDETGESASDVVSDDAHDAGEEEKEVGKSERDSEED